MEIRINVKPMKFQAATKKALMNKVTANGSYNMRFVNDNIYYSDYTSLRRAPETFRVFSLQKYRRKTLQVRKPKTSTVLRNAHWEAHVYDLPVEILKFFRVKQGKRTFKLIPR